MSWRAYAVRTVVGAPLAALCVAVVYGAAGDPRPGQWRDYAGPGAIRYSPLDQINRDNVAQLRVAWRRPSVDPEAKAVRPGAPSSSLMVNDVLYSSNGVGLAVALDPGTGKTIWTQELGEGEKPGFSANRGIAYWESGPDGSDGRIIIFRGSTLYALDAKTGKSIPGFGDKGRVDLNVGFRLPGQQYRWGGPPLVVRDVIALGSSMGEQDRPTRFEGEPGTVRGYDVRTGRLRWTFNIIPREGDPATATWENDSWRYTGAGNVWAQLSADEQLGYIYAPTTSASNNQNGSYRHGNNLYTNSVVCLEAATGRRVWHQQLIHHDLFDYDNPTAPVLTDITVNGRAIKAVVQLTKQGFAYVFDRVTGEPVWPIPERRVESSTVPGEKAARTQPMPTKPPAFDRQGITPDDLIDFTPELRAQALEISKKYRLGPLFTPPVVVEKDLRGTIQVPGLWGGAGRDGGAFDPETGILYVPSFTLPSAIGLGPGDPEVTTLRFAMAPHSKTSTFEIAAGPQGLPLLKPPYGRITAIDLNRGEHLWMVPNADGPRNHPAIKHLNLGPLGLPAHTAVLVTKTVLFAADGPNMNSPGAVGPPPGTTDAGAPAVRVLDKATGKTLWRLDLDAQVTGQPITYMYNGLQYIVFPIGGGGGRVGEFVALATSGKPPSQ